MQTRSENFCRRFIVPPSQLGFEAPTPKEREHLEKMNKTSKTIIIIADLLISVGVGLIMYFIIKLPWKLDIIVTIIMAFACGMYLLKPNVYGVFRGVIIGKQLGSRQGDSYFSVNVWSEEKKQYAEKISWKGSEKMDQLVPGDEVVIYRIDKRYYAEKPVG